MDERKLLILNTIIKEYIKSGNPVGSLILVDKYKLDISPATVRNEMAWLEQEGYIIQPYTSAGRIPTENAYRMFIEENANKKIKLKNGEEIDARLLDKSEKSFKETAKFISEITNSSFFWAFHKNSLYYTGISHLFNQKEFKQIDIVQDISIVIDRMEDIINDIFDKLPIGVKVLIGEENPFGSFCSTIFLKYKQDNITGLCGVLGPLRMDYENNLAIMKYLENKIINL